ncbi:Ger(x)C family spore germination protein [Cohnella hashimotonis]|uniref:Ger(X)C family spore germination protein n=1 Tax=Cohnella hashimotonis TaxID=2826895 RepID=A0ABT6TFX4_9BACL|nr:Ger(x)C family spore germination protein [Cohnella hashimotonis]MDI4645716.1 Ger(x)C family spore germination protein [Cohnella hashimotonis]
MHAAMRILALAIMVVVLTACWDQRSIQETSYVTSLGIDYDEKEELYSIYGTLITMSDVAKTEGASGKAFPSYIGHGKGESPQLALKALYRSTQLRPSLDHLMTIVVKENALTRIPDILDSFNRSRTVRYNISMAATTEPLDELLASDTFFNSPMYTFLYTRRVRGPAVPAVQMMNLQAFIRQFYEKSHTTLLPVLKLDRSSWKQGGKSKKYIYFDGAHAIVGQKQHEELGEPLVQGVKWFHSDQKGAFLEVRDDEGKFVAIFAVTTGKGRLTYNRHSGKDGAFKAVVSVKAYIYELHDKAVEVQLEAWAENGIREKLQQSLATGRARRIDLIGLEDELYRHHLAAWKKLKKTGIEVTSLPIDVVVDVKVTNSGKHKL